MSNRSNSTPATRRGVKSATEGRPPMAERNTKVQMVPGGPFVDGVEVAVDSSSHDTVKKVRNEFDLPLLCPRCSRAFVINAIKQLKLSVT
jgi:hypothetical protein